MQNREVQTNYMEVKLVEVLGAEKSEFSLSEKDLQEIFEGIHQKILQEDTQKKEQTDESDTNSENDKNKKEQILPTGIQRISEN